MKYEQEANAHKLIYEKKNYHAYDVWKIIFCEHLWAKVECCHHMRWVFMPFKLSCTAHVSKILILFLIPFHHHTSSFHIQFHSTIFFPFTSACSFCLWMIKKCLFCYTHNFFPSSSWSSRWCCVFPLNTYILLTSLFPTSHTLTHIPLPPSSWWWWSLYRKI